MLTLCCKIKIESEKTWEFDKITSCKIVRDSESFTDTCELVLPRKVEWKEQNTIPLHAGDKVTVWLGYNDELELAFTGYITNIEINTPITIYCEDLMNTLKHIPAVPKAYRNASLKELLDDQVLISKDGEPIEYDLFGSSEIGQYRMTANTVGDMLGDLQKEYGIRSFFKIVDNKPVLFCGVLFSTKDINPTPSQIFATGKNIIKDDELEEKKAKDIKIKIQATSYMPNNKDTITLEIGDEDGEVRTLKAYKKTREELQTFAEEHLALYKYDGLAGNFTTFGAKLVEKKDKVRMILEEGDKGTYLVSKNEITFGTGGYRQKIYLKGMLKPTNQTESKKEE